MAVAMSKDGINRSLAVLAPFSELSETELDMLASGSRSVTVRKNARVFEEGAPADCCLVLTSGRAKVVLSGDNGADILLRIIRPVSLVGEVALLDRSTRSASLVAMEPCHFIRIPAPLFERLRRNIGFESLMVARAASRRFQRCRAWLGALGASPGRKDTWTERSWSSHGWRIRSWQK